MVHGSLREQIQENSVGFLCLGHLIDLTTQDGGFHEGLTRAEGFDQICS